MLKRVLIVILLFNFSFCYSQQIEGEVISAENSQGIPFAKLNFIDHGTIILADSIGNWIASNLPVGENHVIIKATGFKTVHENLYLHPDSSLTIVLEPLHYELDKVIVSNNGYLHRESITNVESLRLSDINKIEHTTLGQSIAEIPGVYQSSIGTGISKPVIRGRSGSSVITYVNGLRIQNQQWGNDHGLPITSIGIGSVEVIKGPASLLYGADALGGVLYFVDEPYEEKNKISGFVSSRFESNNLGTSNQAGIKFAKENFRFNLYGGYDNYADYSAPEGGQVLNSRFNQSSAKLSMGYSKKRWVVDFRYNFYHGRIGLPGHTHDSVPDLSSFLTSNQNRGRNVPAQVINNHFFSLENKFFLGKQELYFTLGNTNNNLKEHEEKFFFPDIIMNLNNSLYNFKWRSKINKNFETIVGSQGMFQINENGEAAVETLIPNARTLDLGLYALAKYKFKKLNVLVGLRYDTRQIETTEDLLSENYQGFNYSAGFSRLGKNSTFRFNVSSGFRAPNTSELLSNGVHHGAFRYELGNAGLKTEKAVQIDASYALHYDDLELIINPFYNRIQDYIYIEQGDTIINGYPVYEYSQANFAQLYGLDFGVHYHPHRAHWLHIESSLSNVFAEDENRNPLPLIPQTRLSTKLIFNFNMDSKFRIEEAVLQHQYFFKQNRLGIFESETADFDLLNFGINMVYDSENPLLISVGVRNILNTKFIDHLSQIKPLGIPNPGINAYFSIKYKFNN